MSRQSIFPGSRVALGVAVLLVLVLSGSSPAAAYDAGYHFDLTREALIREGCGPDAITVTQIGNYNNDGFESAKAVMRDETVRALYLDDDWGNLYGSAGMRDASDDHLHFDALSNFTEVAAAWDALVRNTSHAARDAEAAGDAEGLMTVLGMSLHQLQDFYAHSNWSEIDWGGDATWFDVPEADRRAADLYTSGRVGHDILHKDCAGRPFFETSYRQAFYASWQWVHLVRSWVSPAFWDTARAATSEGCDLEAHIIRYLAWYTGHWKGPSSESRDDNAALGITYMVVAHRGYLDLWRTYCPTLTGPPETGVSVPVTIVRVTPQTWLSVRTDRARQTDNDLVWDIDPSGSADFYAKITVNGLTYLEAMHEDSDDIRPTNWLTLVPLGSAANVRVAYELWDEDVVAGGLVASFRGEDDFCDISRDLGRRWWFIDGPVGLVSGSYSTDGFRYGAGAFDPDGDGDEAAVDLTISVYTPPYLPLTIGRAYIPLSTPPPAPTVTDDGAWTTRATGLAAAWHVAASPGGGGPPLEYQYRVLRSTGLEPPFPVTSTAIDWTSAGLATSADIPLALEHGRTFFVQVKARNSIGWSEPGLSDGITADLVAPILNVTSLTQTTALPPGLWPSGPPVRFPNSLAVGLNLREEGSGLDRYTVRLCHQVILTGGPNLPGGTAIRTCEAHATFHVADLANPAELAWTDLPLTGGEEYILEAVAYDRAGNESARAEARVTITFTDTTPPPAPRLYVANPSVCAVEWDPVFDSESGLREYFVAVGSLFGSPASPDLVPWTSVGRQTRYSNPAITTFGRIWVKAVNGAGLETVATYAKEPPGLGSAPPTAPIRVTIWGKDLALDVAPRVEGGRVLVPMRALFEGLGATVTWDPTAKRVTGKRGPAGSHGETAVVLTVGSKTGSVRGNPTALDVAPVVIGGRVFVPLRFISEVLGADVKWDAASRTVRVVVRR
jgi:hypothetical protein